jgi:hypothetical protein
VISESYGDPANVKQLIVSEAGACAKFKFIMTLSGLTISTYSSEQLRTKTFTDADGILLARAPVVNVLLIGPEGGLAHRRVLGWICLIDCIKLSRDW